VLVDEVAKVIAAQKKAHLRIRRRRRCAASNSPPRRSGSGVHVVAAATCTRYNPCCNMPAARYVARCCQVLEEVVVAYFKAKGDRPVTREDKIRPTQATSTRRRRHRLRPPARQWSTRGGPASQDAAQRDARSAAAAAVAVRGLQAEMVACVHAEADKSAGLETQYVKNAVERFRYQVAATAHHMRTWRPSSELPACLIVFLIPAAETSCALAVVAAAVIVSRNGCA
jgi:hypothetical protein